MNMPFELGLDHGCRRYGSGDAATKSILILEETRYDSKQALSDIGGWDIEAHSGDHVKAVRHVAMWLHRQAGAARVGAAHILGDYAGFQEWHWERELALGASEDDIRAYPTVQIVTAMVDWVALRQPI